VPVFRLRRFALARPLKTGDGLPSCILRASRTRC
jgi:hypothetical protein